MRCIRYMTAWFACCLTLVAQTPPQSCRPGNGVQCTPNLNLWLPPESYPNWHIPMNDNFSAIDTWSSTVCLTSACVASGQPLAPGSYTLYVMNGTTYARNNNTQQIDFSGTDAAAVINSVLNGLVNVGGRLYFQNGTYPLNSCTQESVAPYTNYFYAVGIPSTNAVNYPSFYFEGESAGIGSQVHPAQQGALFVVSTAAENCAGAGNQLIAFWMRPNTAYDTQYPGGQLYWNDHIFFKNMAVNFQNNQRGKETAIDMTEASFGSFDHVQAGFVTASSNAATASGLNAFVSPATPSDGSYFFQTHVDPGYYLAYGINTEHSVLINTETFRDTLCYGYGFFQGRNKSPIVHNSVLIHPQAYDCINALAVGGEVTNLAPLDLFNFDLEYVTSGPWAAQSYITTGPNAGLQVSGEITWDGVITNVGPSTITSPFTNDGYSGTYYNVFHQGIIKSNLGVQVTGNGSASTRSDFKATRASEVNTAGDMPWLEMDGPNGDAAVAEFGGALEFWVCPGSSCTTWAQVGTLNGSGLSIGSSPVPVTSTTPPTVNAGVCWKSATTLGTCTAGTWPNCTTCN